MTNNTTQVHQELVTVFSVFFPLPPTDTLPACRLSTCAQECQRWWAPCWPTSTPTTPTPPSPPTMCPPRTDLLHRTSAWVSCLNACMFAAGPLGMQMSAWRGLQMSNQPSLVRLASGLCSLFLSTLFCSVFPVLEGEVCQTAGSAAQLLKDWPVYVPGTEYFSLL